MSKVRSSRGVLVDFDQIRIKQQLSQAPTTTDVKAREDHVEERLKRRATRRAQQLAKAAKSQIASAESMTEFEPEIDPMDDLPEENSVTRKQQIKRNKVENEDNTNQ